MLLVLLLLLIASTHRLQQLLHSCSNTAAVRVDRGLFLYSASTSDHNGCALAVLAVLHFDAPCSLALNTNEV
jgi:hypothetical protein